VTSKAASSYFRFPRVTSIVDDEGLIADEDQNRVNNAAKRKLFKMHQISFMRKIYDSGNYLRNGLASVGATEASELIRSWIQVRIFTIDQFCNQFTGGWSHTQPQHVVAGG
jgi:hypothetical protein